MTVARVQLGLPQVIRLLFVFVALSLWYVSLPLAPADDVIVY